MTKTLEERVDALERRASKNLARANAHEKLILSAYSELIMQKSSPLGYVAEMKKLWTSKPSAPARAFLGIDPAWLDQASAEYDTALADILGLLEVHINSLMGKKSSHPAKD